MINKILTMWKEAISTEGYSIYIHYPFCGNKCKYCVYTGNLIDDSYAQKYKEYTQIYLPKAISQYKDIFTSKVAENLYFGGGTPNLLKPDDMVRILESIPNFYNIKNKIIDLHPLYLTDKKIETIIKLGFTTVCIGVQSFDDYTLNINNRKNPSLYRIKDIVNRFNDAGVYTSIDLMTYISQYNTSDINILKNDLDIATTLNLDFIDINPNLHLVLKDPKYGDTFEKATDSFIKKYYKNYISEKDVSGYNSLNDRWIYRIIKKDSKDKFYSEILPYYADDFPYAKNNIIGIGDLNNGHSTMSYIHGRLFYIEKNINNEPTYDVRFIKEEKNTHLKALNNMLSKYSLS